MPMVYVLLGERFGKWPWEIEGEPADRVRYYLNVLAAEAEARSLVEGLGTDEPLIEIE